VSCPLIHCIKENIEYKLEGGRGRSKEDGISFFMGKVKKKQDIFKSF
jgi:hypothetical protein